MELLEKNLERQTQFKKTEILKEIGESISSILKRHGLDSRRNLPLKFREEYEFEFGKIIKVEVATKEYEKAFTDDIQKRLFDELKNTLEQFAWAFQNNQQ